MPVGVQIWKRAEASFGVGGLVWVWHMDFCAQWVCVDSDDSLEARWSLHQYPAGTSTPSHESSREAASENQELSVRCGSKTGALLLGCLHC